MTMKSVDLPHLRSVVLAGHAGAGKTTLAEQLLFKAGAIPRLGRVDDGTAHLDFEPEEQKRRESLSLAVGTFEHDGTRISLVDTPGYPDFVADVIEGFAAVDGALFVMDASAGVEAGLEQAVALGRATDTAACFFINKCDRENADPTAALDALRAAFGDKIAPLQIAIGSAESFSGYVDLVHRKAYQWDGSEETEIPIPDELADEVATPARPAARGRRRGRRRRPGQVPRRARRSSDPELEACLRKGVKESILAPVLVGSAAKGIGLRGAARRVHPLSPVPGRRGRRSRPLDKAGATVEVPADENGPLLVRVFKTTADPFVGRLTYLRVLSGTLHSQAHVWNTTRDEDERIGQLLLLHGKEQEPIGELKAGEIGAVAKLTVTETGDTLGAKEKPLPPAAARLPAAVAGRRHRAGLQAGPRQDGSGPRPDAGGGPDGPARAHRDRRAGAAHDGRGPHRGDPRAAEAQVRRRHRHPHAQGARTRRRSAGTTKVHGRYKKQTGGHGMFGDVWIELEPNPDGGVEFAEKIVGGSVPKGFFPGVEKGIREAAAEGVLAGYPCRTSRRRCTTARSTPVDSNELSFKIAASMALKDGVHQAKPALLEPIMLVEIRIPEAYMGEVNRDLNGRRGRVLGMDSDGGMQVITAHVPQAELFSYATELRSLAQGRGIVHRDARPLRGRAVAHRREGHRRRTARSSRPRGTVGH